MAPVTPLAADELRAQVDVLKLMLVQLERQLSRVGDPVTLSTMPGSSAPPIRVVAVKVEPEMDPENHPPVRLAALKTSGKPTSTWPQNFDAEHQVKVDPSPTPTVCVCVTLPSVAKPMPTPSRVAERNDAGTPNAFDNS
jgi:hypothetical protein